MQTENSSAAYQFQNIRNKDQAEKFCELHGGKEGQREKHQNDARFGRRKNHREKNEKKDDFNDQQRIDEDGDECEDHAEKKRDIKAFSCFALRGVCDIQNTQTEEIKENETQNTAIINSACDIFLGEKHEKSGDDASETDIDGVRNACFHEDRIFFDQLDQDQINPIRKEEKSEGIDFCREDFCGKISNLI